MTLLTPSGARALDPERVLPEYPRPQFARDSYLNLNGRWAYAITGDDRRARPLRRRDPRAVLPGGPAVRGRAAAAPRPDALVPPHAAPAGGLPPRRPPAAAALRRRGPELRGAAQRGAGRRAHRRLPAGALRHHRRAARRRERAGRGGARRQRHRPPLARQAEAAPGRHLVHRPVRHLADRLGRERPRRARRPAHPHPRPGEPAASR